MSTVELAAIADVGVVNAQKVAAVLDLARELLTVPLERGNPIRSPEDVFNAYCHRLGDMDRESLWVVCLDAKNRVLSDEMVALGGLDRCAVSPGNVLRTALRAGAVALIVIHNHPSGSPEPSAEDDALTRGLQEAARVVGIAILDHVIIGDGRYFSYAEHGRLPQ